MLNKKILYGIYKIHTKMTQTKLEVVPHLRLYSDMDTTSDIVAMIPNGAKVYGELSFDFTTNDTSDTSKWLMIVYNGNTGYARYQPKFIKSIKDDEYHYHIDLPNKVPVLSSRNATQPRENTLLPKFVYTKDVIQGLKCDPTNSNDLIEITYDNGKSRSGFVHECYLKKPVIRTVSRYTNPPSMVSSKSSTPKASSMVSSKSSPSTSSRRISTAPSRSSKVSSVVHSPTKHMKRVENKLKILHLHLQTLDINEQTVMNARDDYLVSYMTYFLIDKLKKAKQNGKQTKFKKNFTLDKLTSIYMEELQKLNEKNKKDE